MNISEGLYKEMFLKAAEGFILSNREGKILEVNPRINQMFGYKKGELIGQGIEILIPQKRREAHEQHRGEFNSKPINRTMGLGMALKAKRKDNSEIPVEISLNFIGHGKNMKIMSLITDISTRIEIENKVKELNEKLESRVIERTQELLQSQNLFTTISRNFPDGTISLLDSDLNYLFFEGKELYEAGIDSQKIIGASIEKRLPKDVKEKVINHLRNVLDGDEGVIDFETKGNFYELNAVPVKGRGNKENQVLIVERNITRKKRAEVEMLNALYQEKALNELKSRFVSMASHEFRTPLSTVLSSISLIDKYNKGENLYKIDKHIGRIRSAVHNLNGILNDFLSLDKLEEGKITRNSVEFDLKEFTEDIIDELGGVLKQDQKINFNHKFENNKVETDPRIIKNIMINLLSNAIKYSPEGSEIDLGIKQKNGQITLLVSDKGLGIPKKEQHHMFERFFRANNVTNIEGTGLGLNIVKKYIDLLEGNITFSSEEGIGTKFKVTLPLK